MSGPAQAGNPVEHCADQPLTSENSDVAVGAVGGEGITTSRTFVRVGWTCAPGTHTLALLDTGADTDAIITSGLAERLGARVEPNATKRLRLCGQQDHLAVRGVAHVEPMLVGIGVHGEVATTITQVHALVVDAPMHPYQLLLGARWLREQQANINMERALCALGRGRAQLAVPLIEPPEWGPQEEDGEPARTHDDGSDWKATLRRTQHALREASNDELDELLARFRPRKRPNAKGAAVTERACEIAAFERVAADMDDSEERRRAKLLEETSAAEMEKAAAAMQEWAARVRALAEEVDAEQGDHTPGPGVGVRQLSATQRARLAEIFVDSARQFCAASRVPRKPRFDLPVQVEFDIDPTAKPTKEGLVRTMADDKRQAAAEQVDILEAAGLIEAINDPTWVHAVVMARKKDGRYRFAIDYRPLNAALRPRAYPLPDTDQVLRRLAQHKVFSVYDLSDAFWHLRLREEDRAATAFHVPGRGTFAWRVLPMGAQPATAAWQQNMERVLAPLLGRGAEVFVDDVALYANSADELLRLTEQFHALLERHDLRAGAKKAQLFRPTIEYLGHSVAHGKIEMAPNNRLALEQLPKPSSVADMQRFLGLANYQREHIPKLGHMSAPLTEMMSEAVRSHGTAGNGMAKRAANIRLEWTAAAEKEFEALRQALASPPALTVPDMRRLHGRVRIESDACTETNGRPGGVGGTAWWRDADDKWRMVSAFSRVLKPAERNYAPIEVEMLGIIETLRHSSWLVSKATGIEAVTDHQALTFLATLGRAEHGRYARWAARLLEHDLVVSYRRGDENVVNDTLSRAPIGLLLRGEAEVAAMVSEATADELTDVREEVRQLIDDGQRFGLALVDYPWTHDSDKKQRWFRRMPNDEWATLGLGHVLADDAIVLIAAPDCLLKEAFAAVETLGLTYHRTINWTKTTATTSQRWPTCSWEHILIASRGRVSAVLRHQHGLDGRIVAPTREPCRKPEELYQLAQQLVKDNTPLLELFGRQQRPGWTVVGDEKHVFDTAALESEANEQCAARTNVHLRLAAYARSPVDVAIIHRLLREGMQEWTDKEDACARWLVPDAEASKRARTRLRRWRAQRRDVRLVPVPLDVATLRRMADEDPAEYLVARKQGEEWLWTASTSWDQLADDTEMAMPAVVVDNRWCLADNDEDGANLWLAEVHTDVGHAGVGKTLARLRQQGGWRLPGDEEKSVREAVARCDLCQRHKPDHPRRAHLPPITPDQPHLLNHRLHADLVGPNERGQYILSMTDALTRWPEAVVIHTKSAKVVAETIDSAWFARFGAPEYIVTDQGSEFGAQVFRQLCAWNGTRNLRTTPYHPQANGIEERAHRTFKRLMERLEEMYDVRGDDMSVWEQTLPVALRIMRCTVHRATGHTPARLVYGQELNMPATLFDTPALQELLRQDIIRVCRLEDKEVRERVDALARRRVDEQQRLHEIIFGAVGELALDSDNMDNSERAQRAAEAALYPDLQPGTYVRYYVGDRPPDDEGPRWSAVHRIVRRLHGVAVVLARADDPLRQCTQSCMRVRKVEVHDDEREQFDKLAAETEEQVQQQLQLRQQHTWTQTDDGDIEWHIEDIVEARQRAGRRELLVRWANGEETWEGDAHLRREVPHLVHCGEERAQEGGKGFNQGQADRGPRNRCAVGEFFPTAPLNLF